MYWSKIIVDFGCGNGGALLHCIELGAKICYGIDLSHRAAKASINFLLKSEVNRHKYVILNCDARNLPIESNSVDIVISDATLEHIIGWEKVFNEAYRILRPNGKLYISWGPSWFTYNGGHLWNYLPIPWIHLFCPRETIISTLKLFYNYNISVFPQERIDNIIDLFDNLNKLSVCSFRKRLKIFPFKDCIFFQYSNKKIKKLLTCIPILDEIFASSICCILVK